MLQGDHTVLSKPVVVERTVDTWRSSGAGSAPAIPVVVDGQSRLANKSRVIVQKGGVAP